MYLMDPRRSELNKYYRVVRICKICKLPYGIDKDCENDYGKNRCYLCMGMVKRSFYTVGTEGGNSNQ